MEFSAVQSTMCPCTFYPNQVRYTANKGLSPEQTRTAFRELLKVKAKGGGSGVPCTKKPGIGLTSDNIHPGTRNSYILLRRDPKE